MSYKHDAIALFFDHGIYLPSRTLVLGTSDDCQINSAVASNFVKGLHVLNDLSRQPIRIILNSLGGNIVDGFAIFDAISSSESETTIEINGSAESIAAVIVQAADRRVAHVHAEFMLHDGTTTVDARWRDAELQVASHRVFRKRMYDVFSSRTGKKTSYYRERMKNDWYLTATQALSEGLIDEVV
jgi:ATP-dependent Clp protease protease subunit